MEFSRPATWADALAMKAEQPAALAIAGGTDVMVDINFDRVRPAALLDLTGIDELAEWSADGPVIRLGAGVPYARVISELGGRLPGNAPIIDSHFLEDDGDRKATAPVLGILRKLFATSPLADYVLGEDFPGSAVSSFDDTLDYAVETGAGIAHAVGACAMGPESDDVVDPELRVRGVTGLRVVDASVLPTQVAGNTQAPTMAVAWIAADLIRNGSDGGAS